MSTYKELFDFVKSSPTAYHTVATVREALLSDGYTELYENEAWQLSPNGKYFTIRGGSSIIAFRNVKEAKGFMICASHSDFPAFRVKQRMDKPGAYYRLDVEKYGGMIYYSWLDRPLSVAGRVTVKTEFGVKTELVNIDRDIATIPSLAIHLNRGVNDGFAPKLNVDFYPIISGDNDNGDIMISLIAEQLGIEPMDILSHDLFLYNREEGRLVGVQNEYMLCPRLDDLGCVFASLRGFLSSADSASVPVLAIFDNEEVGSSTRQGAASTFLHDTLIRISGGEQTYHRLIANSFMVSADNAHAKHPNHPEMSDPMNAPVLNGGIVVKFNASQRYATDSISHGVFALICERAGINTQIYYNRADLLGGSTLGSISDTRVSVPTVDIGLPELAMHSATETAGSQDLAEMILVLKEFYSTSLEAQGDNYIF